MRSRNLPTPPMTTNWRPSPVSKQRSAVGQALRLYQRLHRPLQHSLDRHRQRHSHKHGTALATTNNHNNIYHHRRRRHSPRCNFRGCQPQRRFQWWRMPLRHLQGCKPPSFISLSVDVHGPIQLRLLNPSLVAHVCADKLAYAPLHLTSLA